MLSFPWRAIRGLYRILLAIPSRLTPWCIALPHEFLEGSRTHSHGQFRQCSLSFLWIWTSSNGGLCPLPHFPTCVCQSEVTSSPTMCLQGALQHHQFSSFAGQRFAELKVGLTEDNIQMQGSTPNTGPGSLQGRAALGFSSVRRPCVSTTGSPRSSTPASWEHGLLLFYFDLQLPCTVQNCTGCWPSHLEISLLCSSAVLFRLSSYTSLISTSATLLPIPAALHRCTFQLLW